MDTKKIIDLTLRNGGGTFTRDGAIFEPQTGYAVGIYVGTWMKVPLEVSDLAEDAINYLLTRFPHALIGTWVSSGQIYLDPVYWVEDREDALIKARFANQIAIYSFATGEVIEVETK